MNDKLTKHYVAIDSLKGIIMLFIVLFHINATSVFDGAFNKYLHPIYQYGGAFGNYFFFMISGYLLSNSTKAKIQKRQLEFGAFIKRRFIKIYPLYAISSLTCLALLIKQGGQTNLQTILLNFLMISHGWVQNVTRYNTPCWFICVLFLCYIYFYFICYFSGQNENHFICLSAAMAFWGYILLIKNWDFPFNYYQNGEGLFSFFTGCCLHTVYTNLSSECKKAFSLIGGGIAGISIILCSKYGIANILGDFRIVCILFLCPVLIICSIDLKIISTILKFPLFKLLGKISMPLLFWHMPLIKIYQITHIRSTPPPLTRNPLHFIYNNSIYMVLLHLI